MSRVHIPVVLILGICLLEGYCECGRQSTGKFSYRRNEMYCSKYCHDFMEIKVDGEKTAYDLWYGTGKICLQPTLS